MPLTNRRRNMIFLTIMLSCILTSMLSTALTTALPPIIAEFDVSAAVGQWLTSGYSLVMGILVLATAYLTTRVPTKKLYLSALIVFTVGIGMDAVAPNFSVLMAGRILQAAGNGILLSLAQVILLTIYPVDRRGSIMGIYGLAVSAAPIVAPTLTGLIVDVFGWHMIFEALFVLCLLLCGLTLFTFSDLLETKVQRFDVRSFLLCAIGYTGFLLGLGNLGVYGIRQWHTLLPLIAGILGGIWFIHRQMHLEAPFLELRIFRDTTFRTAVLASMLTYAVMIAASTLQPFYIQTVCGYSATVSGLVAMPGSLAMAIVSPFTGRIYDKMGIRKLFLIGSICMWISSLLFVRLQLDTSMVYVACINTIRTIAIGCLMMPLVTWGMSKLTHIQMPHGTALLTSLRTVSGAAGSAVFVSMMSAVAAASSGIHGVQVAFFCISFLAAAQVALAFFCVRRTK